jgi:flagellar assembly protein FliH
MTSAKALRPHRFPSLTHLRHGSNADAAGVAGVEPAQGGSAMADGFQQGLDKGYREGWDSGEERGRQEGLNAGLQDGRRQGLEEARQEVLSAFDGLAKPLETALAELARVRADYQAALRKEVVDLVGKVARQVIRCELALQPTQLLALVDETLAAMPPVPDGVTIYLNPEECQRIRELAPERSAQWTLVPDPRLEVGECRVKVGDREADAGCRQRLSACMDQVRTQLLDQDDAETVEALLEVSAS